MFNMFRSINKEYIYIYTPRAPDISQNVFGMTFTQRGPGGKFCLREAPGPQARAEALSGPDHNVFSLEAIRHV